MNLQKKHLCTYIIVTAIGPDRFLASHLLGQGCVLLLESEADSLGVLEELLGALEHAGLLLGGELLGGEVVDAVREATLHEVGVEAHEVLHLLLLDELLELLLLLWVQLVHRWLVRSFCVPATLVSVAFKVHLLSSFELVEEIFAELSDALTDNAFFFY